MASRPAQLLLAAGGASTPGQARSAELASAKLALTPMSEDTCGRSEARNHTAAFKNAVGAAGCMLMRADEGSKAEARARCPRRIELGWVEYESVRRHVSSPSAALQREQRALQQQLPPPEQACFPGARIAVREA